MAPNGQPACILYVQTFADLVTFSPRIHAPVADGVFLPSGAFQVLPPLPEAALCGVPFLGSVRRLNGFADGQPRGW